MENIIGVIFQGKYIYILIIIVILIILNFIHLKFITYLL